MRKLIMLAGAAAIAAAMPALADAKERGRGHSMKADRGALVQHRNDVRIRSVDRNRNGIADFRERRFVDLNGNGIADFRERGFRDSNLDGIDDRFESRRWGGNICPPGLANRNPPCVPPGQVNRGFRVGQRLTPNYRYYTPYEAIPVAVRNEFGIPVGYRYIYRPNDVVYVVDPTTRMIRDIISLIGG